MTTVFISYRRDDSADVTGRMYDRLATHFGRDNVFKDVDSIPFGVDFRDVLDEAVGKCQLFVVVIGPTWLTTATRDGKRRLDLTDDFVRIEVESALKLGIPVIPVLVSGADMPGIDDLPSSLISLAYRNGLPVRRDPDFHRDVDRLIHGLTHFLRANPVSRKRTSPARSWWAAATQLLRANTVSRKTHAFKSNGHGNQTVDSSVIRVTCPECQGVLHAPGDAAGKRGKCPTCGTILSIPGNGSSNRAEVSDKATGLAIRVTCPECQGVLHAPGDAAGKRGKCPTCGTILSIPG